MKNKFNILKCFVFSFYVFDISYAEEFNNKLNDTDNFENSIYTDLKANNNYDKKNEIDSNILDIDHQRIFKSLETLVSPKSTVVNSYDPNLSKTKMELELNYRPRISVSKHEEGVVDLKYSIFYKHSNTPDTSILMVHNNNALINNTTAINEKSSESFYVNIYFDYSTDKNYTKRQSHIDNLNNLNQVTQEKLDSIYSNYSPVMGFRQGIDFNMTKINFKETLELPKIINIWIENSNQLYPCNLTKNQNQGDGYGYLISYSCERLPNLNDYNKEIKILFD